MPDPVVIGAHHRHVARVIQQEGIVTMRRIDFSIGDAAVILDQRLHEFTTALRCKPPVGRERDQQKFCLGLGQRSGKIAIERACRIKIIQCLGNQQIGIRIKVLGKLVALIAQIRLDLEINTVAELVIITP